MGHFTMDFDAAREKMVDTQVRPNDVTDHALLAQLLSVPREEFVPDDQKLLAYIDDDISIADATHGDRCVMNAMALSKLIQLVDVQKDHVVLDVGCGTGYSSAIFSGLADAVVAIESHVDLADEATENLQNLGYDNVAVLTAPLGEGCPSEAPFDVIFIGGSVDEVPAGIFEQLKDGGVLVTVIGHGNSGKAVRYIKSGDVISSHFAFNSNVKALPGFEKEASFEF